MLGVGNRLRGDDGAGPRVLDALRARDLPGVSLDEVSGAPIDLCQRWDPGDEVLLIDAVQSRATPGTVHELTGPLEELLDDPSLSSHGLGVAQGLALARALGRWPRSLVLYGIEAADFTPGASLSAPVASAVASLAARLAGALAQA